MTSTVIATRGERLVLGRIRISTRISLRHSTVELLSVIEIDTDDRIVARVAFDPDDIDAAFAELDARYLAGEAAAHAHTWSLVTGATLRSTGTSYRRRRRTGSTSTTGEA